MQRALCASLCVHVGGLAGIFALERLLAAVWEPAQFAGRQTVMQLELSMASPTPEAARPLETAFHAEPVEPSATSDVDREPSHTLDREIRPDVPRPVVSASTATSASRRIEPADQRRETNSETPPQAPPRTDVASTIQPPSIASPVSRPELLGTNDEIPPDFRGNRRPVYPAEAYRQGDEGEVLLRLFVSDTGRVERVEVVRSSGHLLLDRTAVDAVKTWRGIPARRSGVAVASIQKLPVRFRLGR